MIKKLAAFFQQSSEATKDQTPEGVCPNCWGKQEYDNKIREMYKDQKIDAANNNSNHAFIQKFVVKYIDGITLKKKGDSMVCPACGEK